MADPLLTSLCSICHMHAHKYRCPRCSVLTCSAPCVHRHKQWAQCSGLRDPAAYMKRADLATAKGIDHDYNYLTSLERQMDSADRDASKRGIVLDEVNGAEKGIFQKGEVALKEALGRCGVIVARAPKGMSRSKANQTRWAKKRHHLVWTVEWVHPDGRKELGEFSDERGIGEVYEEAFQPKNEYRPRKKRKAAKERELLQLTTTNESPVTSVEVGEDPRQEPTTETLAEPVASSPKIPDEPPVIDKPAEVTELHYAERPVSTERPTTNNGHTASSTPLRDAAPVPPEGASTAPTIDYDHSPPASIILANSSDAPPTAFSAFQFHLHHPSLPSRYPVLIPLPPTAILRESLRNRLVLEFPTIYVFPAGNGTLPEGFISEQEFYSQARKLIEELGEGEVTGPANEHAGGADSRNGLEPIGKSFDAERVLKGLGEDLKGFG